MNITGHIALFLKEKGVTHVFGYQGGAIMNIIDGIAESGIEYVQNYHEQGSAFCADAYARTTGRIGVAVATSGPGATNLITGIANAFYDSVPCLFITGQERTFLLKKSEEVRQNGFQDMDIVSIVKPITKYSVLITEPNRVVYELEKAFYIATSGRCGAVLVDVPSDIQVTEIEAADLLHFTPPPAEIYGTEQLDQAVNMIKAAKRPTILVGGGIRIAKAEEELKKLIEISGIPMVATLKGLDCGNETYSFSGTYGNVHSNLIVGNADLLIVLGARLSLMQVGKIKENYTRAKVIHIDIDKHELGRAFKEELTIQCNLKDFLANLTQALEKSGELDIAQWRQTTQEWEKAYGRNAQINKGLDPVEMTDVVSKLCGEKTIFTSDVGQNQMWVAQGIRMKTGQRMLTSGGHGAMGFSLPAAIGAKFASPESKIVAFMGDGGLQMNIQELGLLKQWNLAIKIVVFNNNNVAMVRDLQKYFKKKLYGTSPKYYQSVNIQLLAATYGLTYLAVTSRDQADEIKIALNDHEPWLIEMKIDLDSICHTVYTDMEILEKHKIDA